MILWKNAQIHTYQKVVSSMITDKGKIVALGDTFKDFNFDAEINLYGMHVYPAFLDTHLHLIGYGRSLYQLSVRDLNEKQQVLDFLKDNINDEKLFVENYQALGITKCDLDLISKDIPIILRHSDYHSFTVNSYVLDKVGIKHDTGILIEQTSIPVLPLWSELSKDELTKMTELAIKKLHSFGITSILTDDLAYFNSYEETLEIIQSVIRKIPMRIHLLIHEDILDTYLKDKPKESDFIKFNSVKTFYDGTFTSETALMYETYKNSKSNGERIHSKEDWEKLLKKVRDNKLNISIHTIGNRAFDEVVSSLKQYPPLTGIDRIIHASSIKLESLDNLKGMNVALDLQPQFISSDLPWAYNKFESKPILYPFKSMLNNNLQMALSSDAPVEIPNPLLGIYSAVTRKSNYTNESYDMNETLTLKEAFDHYTKDAAKTLGIDNLGEIKVGNLADFIVVKHDILNTPIQLLKEQEVELTIINERIIFRK